MLLTGGRDLKREKCRWIWAYCSCLATAVHYWRASLLTVFMALTPFLIDSFYKNGRLNDTSVFRETSLTVACCNSDNISDSTSPSSCNPFISSFSMCIAQLYCSTFSVLAKTCGQCTVLLQSDRIIFQNITILGEKKTSSNIIIIEDPLPWLIIWFVFVSNKFKYKCYPS